MRISEDNSVGEIIAGLQLLESQIDEMVMDNVKAGALRYRVARILADFYRAPLSMSSVQPILDLAVELNPGLKETK